MPRKPRPIAWSTLSKRFTQARVRAQIADLQALVAAHATSNEKSLSLVARNVQEAAKRGIGQTTPARTRAGMKAVGAERLVEIDGGLYRDTTMIGSGKPRPAGKPIKSWGPKRFLYNDIIFAWDSLRGTIVIGPYRVPWLQQLHEFGGKVTQTAYLAGKETARWAYAVRRRTGKPPRQSDGRVSAGRVEWTHRGGLPTSIFDRSNHTRSAEFPSRPFMQGAAGVQKALAKANQRFRDTFYPRRAA